MNINDKDLDNIIEILDGMNNGDIFRLKITSSDEIEEGESVRTYHHGRCDVGSPWARGCSFDVLE